MKPKSTKLSDNLHLGLAMKPSCRHILNILPMAFGLFAAFGVMIFLPPLIGYWFLLVLIVTLPLGMWLGWVLNKYAYYLFTNWSWQKVDDVFERSKLPDDWLIESEITNPKVLALKKWEQIKEKGKTYFLCRI